MAEEEVDPLRDYIQTEAWAGLIQWLLKQDWALKQFRAETGIGLPAPRSGLDIMIDKAAGFDPNAEFLRAFVPWATTAHWGEDELTPGITSILARIAAPRPTLSGVHHD